MEDKLAQKCMGQMKVMMRSAAFKYHLDPVLRGACSDDINEKCSKELENPVFLDTHNAKKPQGRVDLQESTNALLRGTQKVGK